MSALFAEDRKRSDRRFRLAANDNETVVDDAGEEQDVEGHRLATNDSEIVVDGMRRFAGDDDESDDPLDVAGPSRARFR